MSIESEDRNIENLLDQEALDVIRSLEQPGMPSLLERVVNTYIETAEPIADQVSAAFIAKDADALMHAAHSLKSSSANVGAKRLSGICAELEKFARDGSLDSLDDRVLNVGVEFKLAKKALMLELTK